MSHVRATLSEIDEVVMVQVRERSDLVTLKFDVYAKVKSIAEMGAYVELLEYDNVEGMILLSELTRDAFALCPNSSR